MKMIANKMKNRKSHKKSKKAALFFVLSLSAVWCIAQDCEYEVNEIDKFSKTEKRLTVRKKVAKDIKVEKTIKISKIEWQLKKEGNKMFLSTIYFYSRGHAGMIGSEQLICLLDNGEIIQLPIVNNLPSVKKYKGSGTLGTSFLYSMNEEQLKAFTQQDIKDVRVEAYVNAFDYSLDN